MAKSKSLAAAGIKSFIPKGKVIADLTVPEMEKIVTSIRRSAGQREVAWNKAGRVLEYGPFQRPKTKSVAELKKEHENAKKAYERALGQEIEEAEKWVKSPLSSTYMMNIYEKIAERDDPLGKRTAYDLRTLRWMNSMGWEEATWEDVHIYQHVFKSLNPAMKRMGLSSDDVVSLISDLRMAGVDLGTGENPRSARTLVSIFNSWAGAQERDAYALSNTFNVPQHMSVKAFRDALKNIK